MTRPLHPVRRILLRAPVSGLVAVVLLAAGGVVAAAAVASHSSTVMPNLSKLGPTVQVGAAPVAVAVDSSRHLAWVGSELSSPPTSTLTAISTVTGMRVGGAVWLPGPALDVAVDPTVGQVFVVIGRPEAERGQVAVYSEINPHRLATLTMPMGFVAEHLAVDPISGLLFVSARSSASVVVVSTTTDTMKAVYQMQGTVVDLAVDHARGKLYGTGGAAPGIYVASESTGTPERLITTPGAALAVAVDPADDSVWATLPAKGEVAKIVKNVVVAAYPAGQYPEGLAVDGAAGTVYVGDLQGAGLYAVDEGTGALEAIARISGELFGVGVDTATGTVVAADADSSSVSVLKGTASAGAVDPAVSPTTGAGTSGSPTPPTPDAPDPAASTGAITGSTTAPPASVGPATSALSPTPTPSATSGSPTGSAPTDVSSAPPSDASPLTGTTSPGVTDQP